MVFSGGFYGYVIATLASLVTSLDANQKQVQEKMGNVQTYMKLRHFPTSLYRRVRAYYRNYYEKKTALDETAILHELSPVLRREVGLFLVDKTIIEIAIFADLDAESLALLVTVLNPMIASDDEWIVEQGSWGDEMYIVMLGEAEAIKDGELRCVLEAGAYFGELCALG